MVGSITAIVAFAMYLWERCKRLQEQRKRRDLDNFTLGFLHGIKPMVEDAAQRDSARKRFVEQINDMLERLQPPKGKS